MPQADATFIKSYSKINNIIASNVEEPLIIDMPKSNTESFVSGQLLARDRTVSENVVPFTWTAEAADVPFAGFCLDDVGTDATTVRVVIQGALTSDALLFAEVEDNVGAVSNFTQAKFLALSNVTAIPYDEYAFQGTSVIKLVGVDGQYSS